MPKQTKSSASAGTRKKHAKKAGKGEEDPAMGKQGNQPADKGGKKLSKAQRKALPKVKQYIPPPRPPAPLILDPLDGQGLARTLPADLVVVLRRLGKKDDVTKRKGLEELREGWVVEIGKTEGDEIERELKETALLESVPVWLHNLASLLQSPFHRSLASQLHVELLAISAIREAILSSLSLSLLPGTQNRDVLGSWMVAALEEGRRAGGSGLKSWEESTTWSGVNSDDTSATSSTLVSHINLVPQLSTLVEYLSLSILDPPSLHDDIHPAPVAATTGLPPAIAVSKGNKAGKGKAPPPAVTSVAQAQSVEEDDLATERWARYRIGGLLGLNWVLQSLQTQNIALPSDLRALLLNSQLWTALASDSFEDGDGSLGAKQPPIRRAGYHLLNTVIETLPAELENDEFLRLLAHAVLDHCWYETEATVWEAAGQTVAKFLSRHRRSWSLTEAVPEIPFGGKAGDGDDQAGNIGDVGGDSNEEDTDEKDGDDEEDEEDDADDDMEEDEATEPPQPGGGSNQHASFSAFLDFVSSTCPGVPHLTYPLLVVVISTMPESVLPLRGGPSPQLQNLFAHLFSPVDARALSTHSLPGQPSAFQTFLRTAIDCILYLAGKTAQAEDGEAVADWLISKQLGERVWVDGVLGMGGRAIARRPTASQRVEEEAFMLGSALTRISAIRSDDALASLIKQLSTSLVDACFAPPSTDRRAQPVLPRSLDILQAVKDACSSDVVADELDNAFQNIFDRTTAAFKSSIGGSDEQGQVHAEVLGKMLRSKWCPLSSVAEKRLVDIISSSSQDSLIATLPPSNLVPLLSALSIRSPERHASTVSSVLVRLIDSSTVTQDTRFKAASAALMPANSQLIRPGALDHIAVEATEAALRDPNASPARILAASCIIRKPLLSDDGLHTVLALVCTSIQQAVQDLLGASETDAAPAMPVNALTVLLAHVERDMSRLVRSDIFRPALVAIHHLVALLPRISGETLQAPQEAVQIWKLAGSLSAMEQAILSANVEHEIADLLADTKSRTRPSDLVDVALLPTLPSSTRPSVSEVTDRLLPPRKAILSLLATHSKMTMNNTLPLVDPLIQVPADIHDASDVPDQYDSEGRSQLARFSEAALSLLRADRAITNHQPLIFVMSLCLRVFAQDALALPGGSRRIYWAFTPADHSTAVIRDVEGCLSYALAEFDDVSLDWHKRAIKAVQAGSGGGDALQQLLMNLRNGIVHNGSDLDARILRDVLERFLRMSGASPAEAELWLAYAMSVAQSTPQLAMAVILAIKPLLLGSKALETAQNRLANNLAGVPAALVNDKGIDAIRLLVAAAPPADAAAVFLPQQRAVFVLKHVASWLTDEAAEDLSEEVEYRLAELYTVLAPIVQDLPGAHWDAMYDLVESGLDSSAMDDPSTYCLLYQSLLLLREIRDLCSSNKSLRATWRGRNTQMKLVAKLFLQCRNADSVPLRMIQGLMLDLLSDVSEEVVGDDGLPELSKLLASSASADVQCTAYRIMSQVVRRRTLALVLEVEASVAEAAEGHQHRTISLPDQLLATAEESKAQDWTADLPVSTVLGQILTWLAILDHFDDASRTLRWAYLDQLDTSDLVATGLLPMLFAILGVSEVGAWNFPASQFSVDEFYTDLLQPEELADLVPLASHLYYRCLVTIPSTMRKYYESLKNRQLSMSMLAFTARHFSPIIIAHEFSALKEPRVMAQLTEEGLNVRIAQGGGATMAVGGASTGSAEAIASYVVDEQPMEIGIRLPAEFPLKGVDVRDLKRVGVPEMKWRGWLFSVQQTITSRNGLVLEALTVFKKNVALHFEGVVECAICYSIISLTDRTLPTKPCRTCKNRFHASCLFKWFNSSHSSSCPLCRALF